MPIDSLGVPHTCTYLPKSVSHGKWKPVHGTVRSPLMSRYQSWCLYSASISVLYKYLYIQHMDECAAVRLCHPLGRNIHVLPRLELRQLFPQIPKSSEENSLPYRTINHGVYTAQAILSCTSTFVSNTWTNVPRSGCVTLSDETSHVFPSLELRQLFPQITKRSVEISLQPSQGFVDTRRI